MAGGTGDIAFRMAAQGAAVTVSDINQEMLDVGIERAMERGLDDLVWSRQNAEELTLPDALLRCLYDRLRHPERHPHRQGAGRGAPRAQAWRAVLLPRILDHRMAGLQGDATISIRTSSCPSSARRSRDDEDSYRYLIESIRRFPTMPEFEKMIRAAGFSQTKVEPILGGLVAIHSGWKI